MKKHILYILLLTCLSSFAFCEESSQHATTSLPIPRFASLKADEVNVRKGPGPDYQIIWTYKKPHYPVKIIAEYKHWRKIEDHFHHVGWVHKSLLSGKKTVMIQHPKENHVPIYQKPRNNSNIIGYAKPMVIGNLSKCSADWCVVEFHSVTGWVNKQFIWGILD